LDWDAVVRSSVFSNADIFFSYQGLGAKWHLKNHDMDEKGHQQQS
jgi:hypothetical protein